MDFFLIQTNKNTKSAIFFLPGFFRGCCQTSFGSLRISFQNLFPPSLPQIPATSTLLRGFFALVSYSQVWCESPRVPVPMSCLVPAWSRGLRRAFGSWLSQCRDLLLGPFPMFLVLSVFWSAILRFYLELCCCENAKINSFGVYVYEIWMQVRQKYWRLNNPPFGIGWFSKIVRYKGFQAICLRSNMLMHFWDPQERCNSKKFKQYF